jgi:type IV pilus assembly protein PilA
LRSSGSWPPFRFPLTTGTASAARKAYAGISLAVIRNGDAPDAAPRAACQNADDATAEGVAISGTPLAPGDRQAVCNMTTGDCQLE